MKHVQRALISLCVIIYISFLLFLFGINVTDYIKYLFMLIGATIVCVIYFLIIKKINWNALIKKKFIAEKNKLENRINRVKKIFSFLVYSFMIIFIFIGLSNDGEFFMKNFLPFLKKRVSENEVFNWIIILSPLCFITSL
ncbi:MAG: hypothetical protein ACI4LS_06885 [Treponema sp.]